MHLLLKGGDDVGRFGELAQANHLNPISREVSARVRSIDRGIVAMRPGRFSFANSEASYGPYEFPGVGGGRAWSMKAGETG